MKLKLWFISFLLLTGLTLADTKINRFNQDEVSIWNNCVGNTSVIIYKKTNNGKETVIIRSGNLEAGQTGYFCVKGVSDTTNRCMFPAIDAADAANGIYISVGNLYMLYYNNGGNPDMSMTYEISNGAPVLRWQRGSENSSSTTNWNIYTITIGNSFSGGSIIFDGVERAIPANDYSITLQRAAVTFPHTVEAKTGQYRNGREMLWDIWQGTTNINSSITFSSAGNQSATAVFKDSRDLVINGSAVEITNDRGVQTTVSANQVYKGKYNTNITLNSIAPASAGGVDYVLTKWQKNGSDYSTNYVLYNESVTGDASYETFFVKQADAYFRNLQFKDPDGVSGPTVGQHVTLKWTAYTDADIVGYEIWRNVKNVETATLIAIISDKTVNIYTDTNSTYTQYYSDNLILYDVRAKMQSPNLSAGILWAAVILVIRKLTDLLIIIEA